MQEPMESLSHRPREETPRASTLENTQDNSLLLLLPSGEKGPGR